MLDLSTCLRYYKRPEIQEKLVGNALNRELGVRYLSGGFGKRPDVLLNKADVLEFAKQGVSSFHISEEIWRNPLALSPSLRKNELEELRAGWDFVIDIDCPDWELSRMIAHIVVKILRKHGVTRVSCKFSGNKGFHIGIPYKAFPKQVNGKSISVLFPEGAKRLMDYIIHFATKNHSIDILKGMDAKQLASRLGIEPEKLCPEKCIKCGKLYGSVQEQYFFLCDRCGHSMKRDIFEEYIPCPKCRTPVKASFGAGQRKCRSCKSALTRTIDLGLVLGLDKVLISPRHLYRMAYSLHESSGLVSLPVDPLTVLTFDKAKARPESTDTRICFLDDIHSMPGEASGLIFKALEFRPNILEENGHSTFTVADFKGVVANGQSGQEKVPIELFPPCIARLLEGVKDGKKRCLFILVNFLTSVGWEYPEIESKIAEWNKKNDAGLRDTTIKGQIGYHKAHQKKALPPNCDNKLYYADIGLCTPDPLCSRIHNPVNYSRKRLFFFKRQKDVSAAPKQPGKKRVSKSRE